MQWYRNYLLRKDAYTPLQKLLKVYKVSHRIWISWRLRVLQKSRVPTVLDIALNSSHKDQWMRIFVFVIFCQTEAAGGSQDHLVCLRQSSCQKPPFKLFKIYAVLNFLSQMLQLDSFFGGILGSAGWNDVDCWILFHNRHIGFQCSWLKVRVTTEEFDNIQNSEYYRFLTDSVNISMVVYGKSVWDSQPPRKWHMHDFCALLCTCPERCVHTLERTIVPWTVIFVKEN